MLADNVEARARSERPRNEKEVRAVVQKAVDYCQAEGQLADTRFTLKDLTIIADVFSVALTGLYHPRIQYPGSTTQHPGHAVSQPADQSAVPLQRGARAKKPSGAEK
jgi:membrane-associated HD superfamily phosphohydrolase